MLESVRGLVNFRSETSVVKRGNANAKYDPETKGNVKTACDRLHRKRSCAFCPSKSNKEDWSAFEPLDMECVYRRVQITMSTHIYVYNRTYAYMDRWIDAITRCWRANVPLIHIIPGL